MSQPHDDYKRLELAGRHVEACPVCASDGELWRHSEADTGPTEKAVMCANGQRFGPQDGIANEGCLLYMPPPDFYQPTEREAIHYWNEYAKALEKQRRARRWTNQRGQPR